MKRFQVILIFFITSLIGFSQNQKEVIVMLHHQADAETLMEKIELELDVHYERNLAPTLNTHLLALGASTNLEKALDLIAAQSEVLIAQQNHINVKLRSTLPNDTDYGSQWSLGSTAPGRSNAPEAWDYTTGGITATGDQIVVAVIDDGFDLSHPDLDYYNNPLEIPNDGIDNDNNGYIDDINGWNAYNGNGVISSSTHGQHVSGIVGAKGNNNQGVTGVNWNVEILPISGSSGNEAIVIEAYGYAHALRKRYNETNGAEGAFVVSTNSSFGVDFGNPADYPIWCAYFDSLGAQGILSCGATANININIDVTGDVPTACSSDYMIAVTNSMLTGNKNANAGYGLTTIDLAAPGTNVYNTLPNNNYGSLTGTSMATPHVAGAIALMYSGMCEQRLIDFNGRWDELAMAVRDSLIENGTRPVSSLTNQILSGGVLDLERSVLSMRNYDCIDLNYIVEQDTCGVCDGAIFPMGSSDITQYNWANDLTTLDSSVIALCEGNYVVTLTDDQGFTGTDTLTITANDSISITSNIQDIYFSGDLGSIEALPTGGTPPFSYIWSNGASGSLNNQLPAGTYSVTVSDANDCALTNTFTVSALLGAREQVSNANFTVYPNPAAQAITLAGTQPANQINFYSVDGQLVLQKSFQDQILNRSIDINNLANGIYWVEILDSTKSVARLKLVKN